MTKTWKPGQSGNPAGRPPGVGKVAALRKQIEEHVPGIITALAAQATTGDAAAARLLLERVLPPIRATEQAQAITLPDGSLTDQGRAVLAAAGDGVLAPGQAAQLLAGLGSLAKLIETDELVARIAALEGKHAGKS